MPEEQGSHYMLLEILEEPTALHETLDAIAGTCKKIASELAGEELGLVYFTGSGTSYHAALASHYLVSSLSTRPTNSIPERWASEKGLKDRIDVLSLLLYSDWKPEIFMDLTRKFDPASHYVDVPLRTVKESRVEYSYWVSDMNARDEN